MSSIFGKCHLDEKSVTKDDLGLMLEELNHWNADDKNVWTSGPVGLGHLMLYNTPESLNETLPLYNSLYGLSITADARIDNREELCRLLQITTPEEKDVPDSGLILLLYKKFGADSVKYLIGDFAFVIWDEGERLLFCARDHMGVKPFFYYNDDHFFAFASEKKGLLCLSRIDKTIDKQFFYNQVLSPVVQAADTTLYKNIRRLPPAHSLTFYPLKNKVLLRQYWTLDADKEIKLSKKEDYYEGLLHHFEEAVKCRLRTHYPIGAELSGGLDSSAITGAANHFLKKEGKHLITFSNAFLEENLIYVPQRQDERKYIDAVNKFNAIENSVLMTKDIWDNVEDEIDFALNVNDGLEMWSPTWLMPVKNAAMQRNVRTMLSGFPGDELVSYRGQYYFLDYLDQKQYLKYFLAKSERKFIKLKPFLGSGAEFFLHKLKNIFTLNNSEIKNVADFFKIDARSRYAKGDIVWKDINYKERFKSYRHFQKYRLLKPQTGLRMEAETRFGMYFKTESRYPMADIRLTQFYLSMPNHLKYEGVLSRTAYRTAVHKYLPDIIFERDDKLGNIMPFKSTPDAISKRQESLLKMLGNFENKSMHKNIINIKSSAHRYNQHQFLELLKWGKKNFEN